jgi:hypothetical protein
MRLCVISVKPGSEKQTSFEASLRQDQEMISIQRFIEFEKSLINGRNSPSMIKVDDSSRPNRALVLSEIKNKYDKKYPNVRLDKYIYESSSESQQNKKIKLPKADPRNPKDFKLYCVEVAKKLGMANWMTPKKGKYDDAKPRVYNKRSLSVSMHDNNLYQSNNTNSPIKPASFRTTPLVSRINSRKNSENVHFHAKIPEDYSPKHKKSFDKKSIIGSDLEKSMIEARLNEPAANRITVPKDIGSDEKLKFQYLYQQYKQPAEKNTKPPENDEDFKQRHESLPSIKETKESPRNSTIRTLERRTDKKGRNVTYTEGNSTEKSPERSNIENQINQLNNFSGQIQKQKQSDQRDVDHLFKRIFKNYDNLEKKLYKPGRVTHNFEDSLRKLFAKQAEDEILDLRDLSPFRMELEQLISREAEKPQSLGSKIMK